MNYREKLNAHQRRLVLTFLSYDSDYSVSEILLLSSFHDYKESITADALRTQLHWLDEQSLISLDTSGFYAVATLTDRGLDVARGNIRTSGVRNLLPSELQKIKEQDGC